MLYRFFSVSIAAVVQRMASYRGKYGLPCSLKDDLGLNHQTHIVKGKGLPQQAEVA
jgi:hypothetical protein